MIKKLLIFLLILILFVGSILIAGYLLIYSIDLSHIKIKPEQRVSCINVYVPIERQEVENISFPYILKELRKINYSAENRSSPNVTDYYIYSDTLYVDIVCDYTINKSYLSAKDICVSGDSEEEMKMYTQQKLEKIVEICNISIDWLNAQWTIEYSED